MRPGDLYGSAGTQAFERALKTLLARPLFGVLAKETKYSFSGKDALTNGYCRVNQYGWVYVNRDRPADIETWTYAMAHAWLHLAFGHFAFRPERAAWTRVCEIEIARFLDALPLGTPPKELPEPASYGLPVSASRDELYRVLCERADLRELPSFGIAGSEACFWNVERSRTSTLDHRSGRRYSSFERAFAASVQRAFEREVEQAHGDSAVPRGVPERLRLEREWFIDRFPLLSGITSRFRFIYDVDICRREEIAVAAVNVSARELYINPAAGLTPSELRFVIAHEVLHAALRHDLRRNGKDPYLWNVACDYVVNDWLFQMAIGTMPGGVLYDPELTGLSCESVYDRIATDLRRLRRLGTLRGKGSRDMLDGERRNWWSRDEGVTLDEFYRTALQEGMRVHLAGAWGTLPAGLIEEIHALAQPPIPWDVALARWIDDVLPSRELRRTYARASRRQGAVSDIPLPRYVRPHDEQTHTFGVVVDTSGSMDRQILGHALGAIASFAAARDIAAVRLISCDVAAFDHGFLPPETIGDRIELRGRGGTRLQPGVDLLERAHDFPEDGPILVITDGYCESFASRRRFAIWLPEARTLWFPTRAPIFRFA
jgi:predicted metal-dependent peptidase